MADETYIGLDLGGTRIRAGRFAADLSLQERSETLTLDEDGPEAVIDRMVAEARTVWPKGTTVVGCGVSAPGPIDPIQGVITSPPNLAGWHDVPLRRLLEERLQVPVYLGNDANLAALAEYELGAGRGYKHVIYLTISTGIGSGIIVDGDLIIGARGLGAECGHLMIIVEGPGGEERVSSLEREAAGPAIARQAVAAIAAGEPSLILALAGGDVAQINGKHVSDAARQSDGLALRLLERAGRIIGLGVVSLLHTFNPEVVIIGGGVAKGAGDLLFKPIRATVQKHSLDSAYWEQLQIVPAMLGEDVCLVGAGALAARRGR